MIALLLPFLLAGFHIPLLVKGQSSDFQSCLASAQDLVVITSSDEGYSNASKPFNLRITPSPAAIAYPISVDQISHVVACAANSGMNVSVRSGGHSYAAYGLSGNLVVNLSNFKNLTVDATGKAVAQTGLLLGEVAEGLWNQGQRALPHGSCPYVGIGGHALYGGVGYYSRTAGLLLDRILSAEVVLANGTTVTASDTTNVDLFWALRGAGPSFGIVTSWTFDTLPAPSTTVYYEIAFGTLSADEMTLAFLNWQQFATTAPNELAMQAVFGPTEQDNISLILRGTYYGTLEKFTPTIGALLASLPASHKLTANALNWMDGLMASDGNLDTSHPEASNTFFAKSLVTTHPITNGTVSTLMQYLFGPGILTNITWFIEADVYGGAIASVPADATAFAHRDAFLVFQIYANTPDKLPPYPTDGIQFVENMLAALDPQPEAAYPNYIDPTLLPEEWQSRYFADHMSRLEQIKRDIDPKNIFNFPQAIPPATSVVSANGPTASRQASTATLATLPRWQTIILLGFYLLWDVQDFIWEHQ